EMQGRKCGVPSFPSRYPAQGTASHWAHLELGVASVWGSDLFLLSSYQQKWDELQVSDDLFRAEYEKMVGDNKEIVAFLKKTLNQRVDEIAELSLQLQLLQQAKDSEKDAFEAQLAQLRHEFQETKDMLTSENMALSGKLAALEEFRIQKDELMAKFSDLEEQLTRQEENHKEYVYNLEKKTVIDKERLKKEMLHRVNAVAAEFRKVSNSQMAETTKRTIRENVTISLQLTKITEQSLQLIQENDRLKEAHTRTLKQLDLLEQNERRMAKTSVSNQKLIWMLTTKCKELQAQVDEHLQVKRVLAQTQKTNEVLEQQNQALRLVPRVRGGWSAVAQMLLCPLSYVAGNAPGGSRRRHSKVQRAACWGLPIGPPGPCVASFATCSGVPLVAAQTAPAREGPCAARPAPGLQEPVLAAGFGGAPSHDRHRLLCLLLVPIARRGAEVQGGHGVPLPLDQAEKQVDERRRRSRGATGAAPSGPDLYAEPGGWTSANGQETPSCCPQPMATP
uniref:Cilia- and flagella-associated protein 157 n=1 Tax=Varanus komodoensis TaxID=61221 RepID=A0A8D2LUZ9_VARKO